MRKFLIVSIFFGTFFVPSMSIAAERKVDVPIYLFHYIRNTTSKMNALDRGLSMPPRQFDEFLSGLSREGYHTIQLYDLFEALEQKKTLPKKSIVLTFDDGYQDFFSAARPLLAKHHDTATEFIIAGRVGTKGYLTWDEVRDLSREGFEIGGHTMTHPDLARLSDKKARYEIVRGKTVIEDHLKKPIYFFAYPYGKYNAQTPSIVHAARYWGAVTTHPGRIHTKSTLLLLSRVRV